MEYRGALAARRRLAAFFAMAFLIVLVLPVTRNEMVFHLRKLQRRAMASRVRFEPPGHETTAACLVRVDYATQTIRVVGNPSTCSLYTVASTQTRDYAQWRVRHGLALPKAADGGVALLKVTTSFKYLDYYDAGLMSACLYADMHGIPLYLYVQPNKNGEHWQDVLRPRVEGIKALFAKPEVQTILLSDLDTWFDTTPSPVYHVQTFLKRFSPKASFVIQGERALCACIWIMRRTDFALQFLDRHENECIEKNYCNYFPFEQTAWLRLILLGINNTNGYSFKADVCADDGYEQCQLLAFPYLENPEVAALDWGDFAFVPQNGTVGEPMLHNCGSNWAGCVDRPSLLYHSSHWYWHSFRDQILEFLRSKRPIR